MSPTIWLGESAGFGFCPKRGLAPSLGWRGWSKPRKGIPRVGATLEGHGSLSPGKEDNPNLWSKGASKEQDLRRTMCLGFIAAEDGRKRRRPEASRLEAVTGGDGAGRADHFHVIGQPASCRASLRILSPHAGRWAWKQCCDLLVMSALGWEGKEAGSRLVISELKAGGLELR